ncbi:MAG TPA: hypothetical protein VMN57_02480 [Anaerolineales bacterium]|nr:hypothetical protein [Anaerolineales bacterium]
MEPDLRIQLVKDEYSMLQGFYEDIDNRCITIKGWSITAGLAAIGAGFVYSELLFLAAAASSYLFWYLEGYWRGLSFFFSRRILEIEAAIREGDWEGFVPLQVYESWDRNFRVHGKQTRRYMLKEQSLMPHLFIIGAAVLLYVLRWVGVI